MNNKRLALHEILVNLLGTRNVYFQPPSTVKMKYPCIVYARSRMSTKYANNKPYNNRTCYTVTIMAPDPDSDIPDKVGALPLCRFDRHYTADNLNHDVYILYH